MHKDKQCRASGPSLSVEPQMASKCCSSFITFSSNRSLTGYQVNGDCLQPGVMSAASPDFTQVQMFYEFPHIKDVSKPHREEYDMITVQSDKTTKVCRGMTGCLVKTLELF